MNRFGLGALAVVFPFLRGAASCAISFPETLNHPVSDEMQKQNPFVRSLNAISLLAIPFLLSFFPLYAALRQVKVYEQFVEGAKEGFQVAVTIIPYLVAILVAVGMFRGAGGIDLDHQGVEAGARSRAFPDRTGADVPDAPAQRQRHAGDVHGAGEGIRPG